MLCMQFPINCTANAIGVLWIVFSRETLQFPAFFCRIQIAAIIKIKFELKTMLLYDIAFKRSAEPY